MKKENKSSDEHISLINIHFHCIIFDLMKSIFTYMANN